MKNINRSCPAIAVSKGRTSYDFEPDNNFPGILRTGILHMLVLAVIGIYSRPVAAGAPFVTDDAAVVGHAVLQFDSIISMDGDGLVQDNQLHFGLLDWLELTAGFNWGRVNVEESDGKEMGIAGPSIQIKALALHPVQNGAPGLAFSTNLYCPAGTVGFYDDYWIQTIYAALTESLFDNDRLLIHAIAGAFLSWPSKGFTPSFIWGLGMEVGAVAGLSMLAEVFSGDPDPYAQEVGGAWQAGLRYTFSDNYQIYSTVGGSIWGNPSTPIWGLLGFTFISNRLW